MNKTTEIPHYVIGTRGSLLALTQCLQMKDLLEDTGKATFSLKIIKTEGDENTSAPLWAIDGKDFFTKELDHALLAGEVDMVVHSYKDLGSERPDGIKLATITKRSYANDILFIRKSVLKKLKDKSIDHFTVGTSSPRRMTNIERFFSEYLPWGSEKKIKVTTKSLRGNVNTRLKKCVDGEFDAVVLALPGIERLAMGLRNDQNEAYEKHGNPKTILSELIKELDFMVLPLSTFPAAASQGALAIECLENRDDNAYLHTLLDAFNDKETVEEVRRERELFQKFGGGCHLAIGISVSSTPAGLRQSQRGKVDDKEIEELSLVRKSNLPSLSGKRFIGLPKLKSFNNSVEDKVSSKVFLSESKEALLNLDASDLLITSPGVVEMLVKNFSLEELSILQEKHSWWASGSKTMRKMADTGFWVKGCADSLGEETLKQLRNSSLITMFCGEANWKSLTHNESKTPLGPVLPIYKKEFSTPDNNYKKEIESCSFYYWTSSYQYRFFKENFNLNPKATHACGLGKTFHSLRNENLEITPVSSMSELKTWVNQ
jgi:hydroxymethylbilane synthase